MAENLGHLHYVGYFAIAVVITLRCVIARASPHTCRSMCCSKRLYHSRWTASSASGTGIGHS
jgi:hypothetical protein